MIEWRSGGGRPTLGGGNEPRTLTVWETPPAMPHLPCRIPWSAAWSTSVMS